MSRAWAVRIASADAEAACAIRLREGVEILSSADALWVRGAPLDDEMRSALSKLPCLARYEVLDDEALLVWGERLPSGRLPEGAWTPIAEWLRPSAAIAVPAMSSPRRVTLSLARDTEEREASILVLPGAAFAEWAATAPAVRLKPLTFALCEDGRVAVRGRPLPPLRGDRLAEAEGIALPCGLAFSPRIDAATARQAIGLAPGDLALFSEDATWERIPKEAFVRASRSAAREFPR